MPDSKQTDMQRDISGDLERILTSANIDAIGGITDGPSSLSPDSEYIKELKRLIPQFRGINDYRLKYDLINNVKVGESNVGFLDHTADLVFNTVMKEQPKLRQLYTEDQDLYVKDYTDLKSKIRTKLLENAVTGESVANSIVDRRLNLFKKNKDKEASLSWKNNNPLNIMATAISPELEEKLYSNNLAFTESPYSNEDGTLARFDSYENGWEAAKVAIKEQYADSTVSDMLHKWSNGGYDASILDETHEYANKKIKDLHPSQLEIVMSRMQHAEGWFSDEDSVSNLPLEDYKEYITKNPEEFQEFGVLDAENNFIYDNLDDENRAFEQMVENDDELHRKLLKFRYKNFENKIDNENNQITSAFRNPSKKAHAFAVYDKHGSEGLTKLVNLFQAEEQLQRAKAEGRSPELTKAQMEAYDWYVSNNIGTLRQNFIGRGSNQIQFTPPKSTLDTVIQPPKDLNYWTASTYELDQKNKRFFRKSDKEIAEMLADRYNVFPDKVVDEATAFSPAFGIANPLKALEVAKRRLSGFDPTDPQGQRNKLIDEIANHKKSDFFTSSDYEFMVAKVVEDMKEQENVDSLVKTIQANGQYAGENRWIVNYDQSDIMTKIAADALDKSDEFTGLMMPDGKGNVILDLNRRERVVQKSNEVVNSMAGFLSTDFTWDEEAQNWKEIPNEAWYNDPINNLSLLSFGGLQMVSTYMAGPVLRGLRNVSQTVGAEGPADFFDRWANEDLVEGIADIHVGDPITPFLQEDGLLKDGSVNVPSDLQLVENGGWLRDAISTVMPLAQYMGAIYMSSRAAIGTATKVTNAISKFGTGSKALSLAGASKYLKGGKFNTALNRLNDASKAGRPWVMTGNFYIGDAIIEAGQEQKYSLANYGTQFIDDKIEALAGMELDLNAKYKATSGINRVGVDFLSSFILSSFIDNTVIGGFRRLRDKSLIKRTGKTRSLAFDPKTGKPLEVEATKPYWRNELNEFWYNMTQDLDGYAIRKETDILSNQMLKAMKGVKQEEQSLNDLVELFVKDVDGYMNDDIKDILEQSVRFYNKKLGSVSLDEDQIARIVDGNYDMLISKIADNMYGLTSKANRRTPESVPLKLAQVFERSTTLRTVTDTNGKAVFSSKAQANKVAMQNPLRIIKETDKGWVVKEPTANLWLNDVATKLRRNTLDSRIETIIDNELRLKGLKGNDVELTPAQIKEVEDITEAWNFVLGKTVKIEDREVFITGKGTNKGFKGMDNEGKIYDDIALKTSDQFDEKVNKFIDEQSSGIQKQKKKEIIGEERQLNKSNAETAIIKKGKENEQGLVRSTLDVFDKSRALPENTTPKEKLVIESSSPDGDWWIKEVAFKFVDNVSRNLGLINDRLLNAVKLKNGKEVRIIGKNVGPIKEWDRVKAESVGIPKDIVVKRTAPNGDEAFYVSNRKTTLEPSKWVRTDAGIRLNPDWDRVSLNRTLDNNGSPIRFIKEEVNGKTMYRAPKQGETGEYLLNIQNPIATDEYLSPLKVVSRDIDAYQRNIDGVKYYEPIRDIDQVFTPSKLREKERRYPTGHYKPSLKEQRDAIVKSVNQAGLPAGLARVLAGGWIGSWFDDEDSHDFQTVGMLLGLALGSRWVRNGFKNVAKKTGKKGADLFDDWTDKVIKDSKSELDQIAEAVMGSGHDVRTTRGQRWRQKFHKGLINTAQLGQDLTEYMKKNQLVQSSFGFMEQFADIQSVRNLRDTLLEVGRVPDRLKADLSLRYNKAVGDEKAWNQLETDKHNFVREFFSELSDTDEIIVGIDRKAIKDLSDRDMERLWDEARWRIQHSGGRIENGEFVRNNVNYVEQMYKKAEKDKITYEQFDEAFLRNDKFNQYIQAEREWKRGIKEEWLNLINKELDSQLGRLNPKYVSMAQKFYNFGGGYNNFKKSLSNEDKLALTKFRKDKNVEFEKFLELKTKRNKFMDLSDNYDPIIMSKRKIQQFRQVFESNNPELSKKQIDEKFKQKMFEDWYELNKKKYPRGLKEYSPEDNDLVDKTFKSKEEAIDWYERVVNGHSANLTREERDELMYLIQNNADDMIYNKPTVVIDEKTGRQVTQDSYIIDIPDDLGVDLFEEANRSIYNQFFDILMDGVIIKNSNHLEKPRKYVLPHYMAEHSTNAIMHRYTQDVGRRLHFVRNGIWNESDIGRTISKIETDLLEKGIDSDVAKDHALRMRDIYRVQADINHDLMRVSNKEEMRKRFNQRVKIAKFSQGIRNLIGGAYQYTIGTYDIYQHAIMSPVLTSWKSYGKAAGDTFILGRDPDSIRRINNMATTLHFADQRIKTFMPEIDEFAFGDVGSGLYGFTQKFLDVSSRFSITKTVGNSPTYFGASKGLWDVDSWGIGRLFFDDFYGVNQTATSINALSHLYEAQRLAGVYKQLKELPEGERFARIGGKRYSMGDVMNALDQVGIKNSDVDAFVKNTDELDKLITYLNGKNKDLSLNDFDNNAQAFGQIENILQSATDTYHGRNKMFRPESWTTPLGKLMAQYSIYPSNFALQTTQRKIRYPMQNWNRQYSQYLKGGDGNMPWMKMWWLTSQGEKGMKKLRGAFNEGTPKGVIDDAIDNIPITAWNAIAKGLLALPIGLAMTAHSYAVQDIVTMATNSLYNGMTGDELDYEPWERTQSLTYVNPYAPDDKRMTIADAMSNIDEGLFPMMGYFMGRVADMGYVGKQGNVLFQQPRFQGSNALSLTPVTQVGGDAFVSSMRIMRPLLEGDLSDGFQTASKESYDFFMSRAPIIGSFSTARNKLGEKIFNDPSGKSVRAINTFDNTNINTNTLNFEGF